jgi:hypothetical protein
LPEPSTIFAAALVAVVPSLVYLFVLNLIDRYEPEPWSILFSCIGAGALVAPAVSVVVLVLLGRQAALPPGIAPRRPSPDARLLP